MSRKLLVYLYPREWRERYGEGFRLLLDVTPLTARVILNVVLAAGRQRLMHTLFGAVLCGLTVTYAAWHMGQYLNAMLAVEPTLRIPVGSGGLMLTVPSWPAFLGLPGPALLLAALYRVGMPSSWPGTLVGEREFIGWVAALFLASSLGQWLDLRHESPFEVWKSAATSGTFMLFLLKVKRTPIAPQQPSPG